MCGNLLFNSPEQSLNSALVCNDVSLCLYTCTYLVINFLYIYRFLPFLKNVKLNFFFCQMSSKDGIRDIIKNF